jgi:type II secretion system protein G
MIFTPVRQKGFTLIELLVVIAVIGILASVVLASLNSARGKGRDAKRLSDLKQVQTALELYYSTNGSYPSTSGSWRSGSPSCTTYNPGGTTYTTTGASGYISNLAPTYIPVLPLDPKPIGTEQCYLYNSNGTDYMFLIYQTVEGRLIDSLLRPAALTQNNYTVYTPGASNW